MSSQVKIDELILLTIKKIGINGEGVGFYKRQTVFVEDALPGEVVEVQITNVQPKYAYGKITKFKKKSDQRIVPKCPYYDRCGGCQLQHLSYDEQLVQKENLIRDSLARYYDGGYEKNIEIRPCIGMDNPWEYRNFSQLPTRHDGEKVVVGIFEKNSNRLVYIDKCIIENQLLGETTGKVLNELTKANISVYNPRFNQGSLRNLIIRALPETKEVQVTAVLFEKDQKIIKSLKNIPNITSMNYSINHDVKSDSILHSEVINIGGKKNIKGKLLDFEFEVFPDAFYPLNSHQLPVLYQEIKNAAKFNGAEKVVSFYAGIGTLELYLSKYVHEIRGIDNDRINYNNAELNLKYSKNSNISFYYGEVLPHLHQFEKDNFKPDVLIINPFRGGIELNIINYIQKSKIDKIIYVSSNPSTLAKNINHLQKHYKVEYIQPFDMQPQTIHLEAICVLKRI